MGPFAPIATAALFAGALVLGLLLWRRRQSGGSRSSSKNDPLDAVQALPVEAARVLTIAERRAYDLLRTALPGYLVLAQVPLGRFLRVPAKYSKAEWMKRVGSLSADLLVCDSGSKVLSVIDIHPSVQTDRSRRRHAGMARVLKAAGISVLVWSENQLPSISEVRTLLGTELARIGASNSAALQTKSGPARPMPLIPIAEMVELLAQGDQAAMDMDMAAEPVASGFFDELDMAPKRGRAGR